MKGKALFLSTAVMSALAGCSTTPEPQAPEPLTINPVHLERCYSMDTVGQETAGRAYLAEGRQFYFHVDCDQHLALQAEAEAAAASVAAAVAAAANTAKNDASAAADGHSTSADVSSGHEGVAANKDADSVVTSGDPKVFAATIQPDLTKEGSAAEKEPTCYSDKMTAGRGDLPPCDWDEEKQEPIKK
jgi:hypothetical protein